MLIKKNKKLYSVILFRKNEPNCLYTITNIPAKSISKVIKHAKNFVAENGYWETDNKKKIIKQLIVECVFFYV